MEQREGNSSVDLSEPPRHCTQILLLRKSTWHNTTRGPYCIAAAHSPRLHSDWGMLAQSPGRLVARPSGVMRLPGQSFANPTEMEQATRVATAQLNLRAKPWVWGRPPKTRRLAIVVASFPIAFEEWSTSISKW